MSALFEALLNEIGDRVAVRVAARLRADEPGMIAQSRSPLGRRRHCAAVKRRVAQHEFGAAVVGRQHLLSPEALAQELERASIKPATCSAASSNSVRNELIAELQLLKTGGRRG
jgi:hypothetical protein